jgi:DNA polymerase
MKPVGNNGATWARTDAFAQLMQDVRACRSCARMAHAHVLGGANGPLDAQVLFIAEAVGRRGGALTGVPLTRDETGKRFERFLRVADIDRRVTFVTNAILCNPLDAEGRNRPPSATEVSACRPFLARTVAIVRAPVIVTLGRVALESLRMISPHDACLSTGVGRPVTWRDRASGASRTLVPMYHPSRQSTLHRAQDLQEADWRQLGAYLRERMPVPRPLATMHA